ncbi:uncharacterized protein DS421_1g11100 [Arachis hypogaea]|nr:uncharacterized protein DS421_1g11100 [Arachis hypogaea]
MCSLLLFLNERNETERGRKKGDRGRKERGEEEGGGTMGATAIVTAVASRGRERNTVAHPRVEIEREQAAPLPPRVAVANARVVANHPCATSKAKPRPEERARAIATGARNCNHTFAIPHN